MSTQVFKTVTWGSRRQKHLASSDSAALLLCRYLYKLNTDNGLVWVPGILQVGLSSEEKAALDSISLEELTQEIRNRGRRRRSKQVDTVPWNRYLLALAYCCEQGFRLAKLR